MPQPPAEIVIFEGDEVVATLPEGTRRSMKFRDLLRGMLPTVPDSLYESVNLQFLSLHAALLSSLHSPGVFDGMRYSR